MKVREGSKKGEIASEKQRHEKKVTRRGKKTDTVLKRITRANRKELLELIRRKNEMLQKMENVIKEAAQDLKNKDDKIVRMAAEFENYKKRTRREWELHQKKAGAELITNILGILDDFDRAMETVREKEDHFHSGIRMIFTGLIDVLKRAGLKEIEAQSRLFDPNFHEAVGEIESDEVESGHVANVVQKGYMLYDQLLRPARVIVAKKN
ncbi:MAG: nucleotide exchange factor GrpE [Candidatus Krumholzibacteria bacterium]|nr:nucleotide exchange factor GrpE [Candidatus Krumholzibacteria bacterium]